MEHEGFAVLEDSRHDPMDIPDEEETPEAFIWSCCDKHGDEEGCVESRHVPKSQHEVKRARN